MNPFLSFVFCFPLCILFVCFSVFLFLSSLELLDFLWILFFFFFFWSFSSDPFYAFSKQLLQTLQYTSIEFENLLIVNIILFHVKYKLFKNLQAYLFLSTPGVKKFSQIYFMCKCFTLYLRIFLRYQNHGLQVVFSQHLKYVILLSSSLHCS